MKVLAGTPKHLGVSRGVEKERIDYLMLNLPFKCNYKCIMCCNGKKETKSGQQAQKENKHERNEAGKMQTRETREQQAQKEKRHGREEASTLQPANSALSVSEIERVLVEAKSLGARAIVVAGEGEPFLMKEAKKVISHAHSLGMASIVFTNASFPLDGSEREVRETTEFLLASNATVIASFHGFTPETYERIVGRKNSFERAKRNLEVLRDVFKASVVQEEGRIVVRLAVNFVLNKLNLNEVQSMKAFCADDVMFVCNHVMPSGSALGEWGELVGTREEYERMKEMAARESDNNGLSGLTVDETRCAYWARGISIGSTGEVLTCAYTGESAGAFGNVREDGLKELKKRVDESVRRFEGEHGAHFCIKRHAQFQEYVHLVKRTKTEK
ncbi:radical SAM protein [Candidatus Micrarchaeota archaeon]|nr:radical SAM protein [Candidatus Micrarchaeota archaeon]